VGQNSHSVIVLHGTGGVATQTVEELGDWFRSDPNETSSHFGVGRDGRIAQYVRLSDGAAANCCVESGYDPYWQLFDGDNLNHHTISIEHVNDMTNSLPLTPAQQDASFKLVAWLCNQYGLTFNQVKTHASIAPLSRAHCPGNYPLDALKAYLSGGNMSTVPQGWHDDGTTLTAPNGHKVVRGFRDFVLANNWDPANVPQGEEYGANPAQLHRTDLGSGTRQVFLHDVLWWTPVQGVIREQLWGIEMNAAYALVTAQEGQIATLQAKISQTATTIIQVQAQTDLKQIAAIADKYK
jgi:hypothetical protein